MTRTNNSERILRSLFYIVMSICSLGCFALPNKGDSVKARMVSGLYMIDTCVYAIDDKWEWVKIKTSSRDISMRFTQDSVYFKFFDEQIDWIAGAGVNDTSVVIKNGTPIRFVKGNGDIETRYLNTGYAGANWSTLTTKPSSKDLVCKFTAATGVCIINSSCWWMGRKENESLHLDIETLKSIPGFIQNYDQYFVSCTMGPLVKDDAAETNILVKPHSRLYIYPYAYDDDLYNPFDVVYVDAYGLPLNTRGEMLDEEKIRYAIKFFNADDYIPESADDQNTPGSFLFSWTTNYFEYFVDERFNEQVMYGYFAQGFGTEKLDKFPPNTAVVCYGRYYPEGYENNPDYYIEGEGSDPIYFTGTSGISDITTDDSTSAENAPIYNLYGVQVDKMSLRPGIYIQNGKKILIK